MRLDPLNLPQNVLDFLAERHLATLSTLRPDGTLHVVPVGFSWDDATKTARVITRAHSAKVRNLASGTARAALSQVDGGRWLTLEGVARVASDAETVERAVAGYALRYRPPASRDDRVALEIRVDHVMGRC